MNLCSYLLVIHFSHFLSQYFDLCHAPLLSSSTYHIYSQIQVFMLHLTCFFSPFLFTSFKFPVFSPLPFMKTCSQKTLGNSFTFKFAPDHYKSCFFSQIFSFLFLPCLFTEDKCLNKIKMI